jgi:hypothetical protein
VRLKSGTIWSIVIGRIPDTLISVDIREAGIRRFEFGMQSYREAASPSPGSLAARAAPAPSSTRGIVKFAEEAKRS